MKLSCQSIHVTVNIIIITEKIVQMFTMFIIFKCTHSKFYDARNDCSIPTILNPKQLLSSLNR